MAHAWHEDFDSDNCVFLESGDQAHSVRSPTSVSVPTRDPGSHSDYSLNHASQLNDERDHLRRPCNSWTLNQRVALLLLVDCYSLRDWPSVADIFNKVFKDDLELRGFFKSGYGSGGMTTQALRAQYDELHDDRHEYAHITRAILASARLIKDLPDTYFETNCALLRAALDLGIGLDDCESIDKDKFPLHQRLTRRRRKNSVDTDTVITVSDLQDMSDLYDSSDASPSKRARRMLTSRASHSRGGLSQTKRLQAVRRLAFPNHDDMPFLLFRVYAPASGGDNSGNGFWSGLQLYGPPPDLDDELLVPYALSHLNRELVASPFISMASSLGWTLKLAHQQPLGARIAVIEPRAIGHDPYYCAPLCTKAKATGRTNFVKGRQIGYMGNREWWAWNHIPASAIIADKSLQELQWMGDDLSRQMIGPNNHEHTRKQAKASIRTLFLEHSNQQVAAAVGTIVRTFFPVLLPRHVAVDMTRIIVQSFGIAPNLEVWAAAEGVLQSLEHTIGMRLRLDVPERTQPATSFTSEAINSEENVINRASPEIGSNSISSMSSIGRSQCFSLSHNPVMERPALGRPISLVSREATVTPAPLPWEDIQSRHSLTPSDQIHQASEHRQASSTPSPAPITPARSKSALDVLLTPPRTVKRRKSHDMTPHASSLLPTTPANKISSRVLHSITSDTPRHGEDDGQQIHDAERDLEHERQQVLSSFGARVQAQSRSRSRTVRSLSDDSDATTIKAEFNPQYRAPASGKTNESQSIIQKNPTPQSRRFAPWMFSSPYA